ncbi:MAG: hypothetical protein HY280_04090, partial [Nitrospinae bacterium]|nr:hypothetical protein [Nitrospinota bacterium]
MGNRLRIFSIQIELRPVILSLVSVLFLSFYSAVAFSAENPPPPPAPVANDVAVPTQTDAVKTMRKDGEHPVWDATHKIGTITILNRNVFDLTNPSENGWIGKLGDKIHIITRERTIRNELLFKEGEPYNARLIDETARNLRAKSYLTEVEITSFKGKAENTVDVVVTSRDQWTLLVGTTFGGT